jgi:hypothetical protein
MSLVCTEFENLPKGVGTTNENGDRDCLLFICFQELVMSYPTCDLAEEFCDAKIFPIHAGWLAVTWSDFASPIKIPNFARSF